MRKGLLLFEAFPLTIHATTKQEIAKDRASRLASSEIAFIPHGRQGFDAEARNLQLIAISLTSHGPGARRCVTQLMICSRT
ncbi:hypothetical protein BJX68DRAFT_17424 [Aspergillus pseudodeflectus]|uniref:Uncharacterized protein n=1 Tax=Aspergillus pseudodeflectus TaxID=176178 RepID=A0ABR4LCA9_9EURO